MPRYALHGLHALWPCRVTVPNHEKSSIRWQLAPGHTCSPKRDRGVSSSATARSSMVVPWLETERCRAMDPACRHALQDLDSA